MSVFTAAELAYLAGQPLLRMATASADGKPDVAPVGFGVDGDDIVSGGFDITRTVRYRNVRVNPRACVVVDDLASVAPWSPRGIKVIGSASIEDAEPRGIKVIGSASIEDADGGPRFRISPDVIISWGINDTAPGIPAMERRVVRDGTSG